MFLSIRELKKPEMCNRKGDDIAYQVAGAQLQDPINNQIEPIIDRYISLQEKICSKKLPIVLDEKLRRMDQEKLNRLDLALDCALESGVGYTEAQKQFKKIKDFDVGPSELCLEDSFGKIPSKESYANPNDLVYGTSKQTVEKYLLEPCRLVVEELGPDIFELANNWIQFHKIIGNGDKETQFYRYWAKYSMCVNVLDCVNK